MLEFCQVIDKQTNRYDRQNKKLFQLTKDELFYLVAFSFRSESKCTFKGHDQNTKQVIILRKPEGFIFLLNWGSDVRLKCLVAFPTMFELINLCILALQLNQPWMTTQQITETLKAMHIK